MSAPAETFDPTTALTRALFATEEIVTGIDADQWSADTVCTGWNVGELLDHLVAGNHQFIAALGGEQAVDTSSDEALEAASAGQTAAAGDLDDDPVAAYRLSAAGLQRAIAVPGVLDQLVTVPFGTVPGAVALHLRLTEILVHGWDLAQATGQPTTDFPADIAVVELAFSKDALKEIPTGESPFDSPQPVAASAPAIDQLAALLGRRP
ncbi:TIGR03086 family metal-binding protein [Ruania zhangjianzhongii]|uniref:TIGR03086 family metal-binding protein n=1 Tax=Ruania zhangjianzhongii TaxID=2603206 RepID=UPI0011CCA4AA|nr:TIGR03086 family metal-binding protein [Ruania zhangjianzhongii]